MEIKSSFSCSAASAVRSGVPAEEAALGSTDLKNLDSNLQALTTMQAGAGAVTAQMRVAASRIEDLQITAAKALSSTQDADLAKVSVAYSSEQAAYNARASIVQTSLLDFLH
jgi:flagellin-like hook-associated protein FlgL